MQVQEYLDVINGITLKAQAEIRAIASNALQLYAEINSYYEQNRDELQEQRSRGVVGDTWSQFRALRTTKIEDMIAAMEPISEIATAAMTAIEEFKWYNKTIEDADSERVEYVLKGTRHLIETLIILKEVKLVNRGEDDVCMYVLGQPMDLKLPDYFPNDMRTVQMLGLFLDHANTVDLNINDAISKVESEYIPLSAKKARESEAYRTAGATQQAGQAYRAAGVAYASDARVVAGAKNARTYIADINRITGPAKIEIEKKVNYPLETREIHHMEKAINDVIKIAAKVVVTIIEFKRTYGQLYYIGEGIDGKALRDSDHSLINVLQSIASIELKDGTEVYLPKHLQLDEMSFTKGVDDYTNYIEMLTYFQTMNLTLTAVESGRPAQKRKDREAGQSSQRPSNKPKKTALHLKF